MAHLYLSEELSDAHPGSTVSISGSEARHAVSVSRLRVGESVAIGNGAGLVVSGPIVAADVSRLSVAVESVARHPLPSPRTTLVQALAKGGRDESAVQAATELGVDAVVPWAAHRSVSRWDAAKREKGRERWASIVREASKQSLRAYVPAVEPLASTPEIARLALDALVIVLEPTATQALTTIDLPGRDLVLVVGPEGGIATHELEQFESRGAVLAKLGDGVLRTSTAGPAALAVLNSRLGRW